MVVFARTERHNHAAFGGLREGETKRCEPGRSGAVTPNISTLGAALGRDVRRFLRRFGEGACATSLDPSERFRSRGCTARFVGRALELRRYAAELCRERRELRRLCRVASPRAMLLSRCRHGPRGGVSCANCGENRCLARKGSQ